MLKQKCSGYAIGNNESDEGDMREDASENLPWKTQAGDAFASRWGLFALKATCWHFSSLKFHFLPHSVTWVSKAFQHLLSYFSATVGSNVVKTRHISLHPNFTYQKSSTERGKKCTSFVGTILNLRLFSSFHLPFTSPPNFTQTVTRWLHVFIFFIGNCYDTILAMTWLEIYAKRKKLWSENSHSSHFYGIFLQSSIEGRYAACCWSYDKLRCNISQTCHFRILIHNKWRVKLN